MLADIKMAVRTVFYISEYESPGNKYLSADAILVHAEIHELNNRISIFRRARERPLVPRRLELPDHTDLPFQCGIGYPSLLRDCIGFSAGVVPASAPEGCSVRLTSRRSILMRSK